MIEIKQEIRNTEKLDHNLLRIWAEDENGLCYQVRRSDGMVCNRFLALPNDIRRKKGLQEFTYFVTNNRVETDEL